MILWGQWSPSKGRIGINAYLAERILAAGTQVANPAKDRT
jgi:hypothetical protein